MANLNSHLNDRKIITDKATKPVPVQLNVRLIAQLLRMVRRCISTSKVAVLFVCADAPAHPGHQPGVCGCF
jgi:hypothetical protein